MSTKSTRGGPRPGAGRPKLFQATKGNYLVLERETIGGEIRKPELVHVLSVSENEIELQAGNDIIVLRFVEPDEIGPRSKKREVSDGDNK